MLLDADDSRLLLVDYQERLMSVMLDSPAVIANATRLAQLARQLQVPTLATEQTPDKLGPSVAPLREALHAVDAQVLSKSSFSAVGDELLAWLRPPARPVHRNARSLPKHLQKPATAVHERGTLVMAGCEAHVCLLQTALELLEDEFDVWVVTDACSSRTERSRDAAFDRLAGAGAELVTTEMVGFEWLRNAHHPAFKAWLDMIR